MSDFNGIPIHIAGDGQDTNTPTPQPPEDDDVKPPSNPNRVGGATMPHFNPGRQYHREGGQSYAFQNSTSGIAYAVRHGFPSMDMDMSITLDKIPVNCHDDMPCRTYPGSPHRGGFMGAGEGFKISEHPAADVFKLQHKDGYYIRPMSERFSQAARAGRHVQAEVKSHTDLWTLDVIEQLMHDALAAHCLVMGKCLDTVPGYRDVLARFRKVGFQTRVIHAANL